MTPEVPTPRHHAPGGWRRAVMGLLVGASFGALVTRVIPADRTWPPVDVRDLGPAGRAVHRLWPGRPR